MIMRRDGLASETFVAEAEDDEGGGGRGDVSIVAINIYVFDKIR